MAGRCEKRNLVFRNTNEITEEMLFVKNPYYQQIRTNFPQFYDKIMTQCTSFDEFYQALE